MTVLNDLATYTALDGEIQRVFDLIPKALEAGKWEKVSAYAAYVATLQTEREMVDAAMRRSQGRSA